MIAYQRNINQVFFKTQRKNIQRNQLISFFFFSFFLEMQRVWLCQFIKKKQNSLNPHNQLYFSCPIIFLGQSDGFFQLSLFLKTKRKPTKLIDSFFFFWKKNFFYRTKSTFFS